jgi:hypothetical protein
VVGHQTQISKIRSAKGLLVGQHNASESRYPNY